MKMVVMRIGRLMVLSCLMGMSGCSDPVKESGAVEEKPDMAVYFVKGEVKGIRPEVNTIVVKHDEIPDYMAAMTMPFDVKDPAELSGLETNDLISFRMIVTDDDGWIDQVKKIGKAEPEPLLAGAEPPTTPRVKQLKIGDALPDLGFTNELGEPVRLSEFKGKALAITFVFTRCPFPDFCPRMAKQFSEAQTMLKGEEGDWQLLSITIDPENDTPEVLREYAKRYDYDPSRWTWVTGEQTVIDEITARFGLNLVRVAGIIEHNLRTVVVDADGRVRKIYLGNFWTAEDLVDEMRKAMGGGSPR